MFESVVSGFEAAASAVSVFADGAVDVSDDVKVVWTTAVSSNVVIAKSLKTHFKNPFGLSVATRAVWPDWPIYWTEGQLFKAFGNN